MTEDKETQVSITPTEVFWVQWMRLLKKECKKEIKKSWQIGRLAVAFRWGSRTNLMGRFGGGWNWELGFQLGGTTIIFNLLVCSVRVSLTKPKPSAGGEVP